MDNTNLIKILKERYEHEQFRRNNFDNVIGLPVTIIALLIGGWSAFVFQAEQSWTVLRIGSTICALTIGVSIYFLIRVFFGFRREYDVLPTAQVIKNHYDKLVDYHKELAPGASIAERQEGVKLSFNEDLAKWYVESSDKNCATNDRRAECLHRSKLWLVLSLITIFILVIYKTFTV